MTNFIEPIKHRPSPGPYAHPKKIKGCNFKVGDVVTMSAGMMYSSGCIVLEVLPGCDYMIKEPSGYVSKIPGKWLEKESND